MRIETKSACDGHNKNKTKKDKTDIKGDKQKTDR